MKSQELRQKYLDFFRGHGHAVIGSASLIPENDPTVLFTTAGMHPLVPYLLGEKHPAGSRLANAQKCIRTGDIDEVGDAVHHTFFEMMGNWSLGDYFKSESIAYSWEFLTSPKWLGLDKSRLAVSVFVGEEDIPFDAESQAIWEKIFQSDNLPLSRIARLPRKNNWWGPVGESGPCGPDTEIFYWTGEGQAPEVFDEQGKLWVEVWNNVFMQYSRNRQGGYDKLARPNVDTGLGLERSLAVVNGLADNYLTDLFSGLITKLEELSQKRYGQDEETTRAMRIIADHLKAATFIIGDDKGIAPSNTDQGYVVRRLIRRAIRYGRSLGIAQAAWIKEIAKIVIADYQAVYPELSQNQKFIFENLEKEEEKFSRTLEKGIKVLNTQMEAKEVTSDPIHNIPDVSPVDGMLGFTPYHVTGSWLFDIYQTFGFPLELSLEEIEKMRGKMAPEALDLIQADFSQALRQHQELSRTAAAGKFKGGLADHSEETTKLHTSAHLLLAALRQVLGDHVVQKGSNITPERLRLDFSHPDKLTPEQLAEVERLVNMAIDKDWPVVWNEMSLEEAKRIGAMGVFDSKYGETVKVYQVADFSKEICGGPHVERTGVLGRFKIQKEESSSAGVRRIKAVLGN